MPRSNATRHRADRRSEAASARWRSKGAFCRRQSGNAAERIRPPGNTAGDGRAAIVVLGSVGLYASLGGPELPAFRLRRSKLRWLRLPDRRPGHPGGRRQQAGGDVNAMVKRLEQRLEANPKDADSWRVLGWSYDNHRPLQRKPYHRPMAAHVELQKDNALLRALYGEAQVKAADGMVTAAALTTFARGAGHQSQRRTRPLFQRHGQRARRQSRTPSTMACAVQDSPAGASGRRICAPYRGNRAEGHNRRQHEARRGET